MRSWLLTEKIDGITFRVKESSTAWPFYAEAIRGDFTTDNSLYEPPTVDVWFEFGTSAEEVMGKLKDELFNRNRPSQC